MNKQQFKDFLTSNKAKRLINNNDYTELYWRFSIESAFSSDAGYLTKFLYSVGINPLAYFKKYVPEYFMSGLDANMTNIGKEIIIPGKIERINPYAFSRLRNIKSIVVQEGVKDIEAGAFSYISGLYTIFLPSTLDFISELAFVGSTGFDIFYSGPKSKVPELFDSILEDEGIDIYYLENNEWIHY